MRKLLNDFTDRYFHDEESIILVFLLTIALVALLLFGSMLAPLIVALIIAYLMQGLVALLLKYGFTERLAFIAVYVLFFGVFITMLGFLLPQVWNQLRRMMDELPNLLSQGQALLLNLPENYPSLFSEEQINSFMDGLGGEVGSFGQAILEYSLASLPSVVAWVIFLVLVPILVFFMMKDKHQLLDWVGNLLPRNRPLMSTIWREMDQQIANYVRGKFVEIIIVGSVAYLVFVVLGLNYALLLSVITGLSVMVPYIGAAAVNIPVAAIAYVQWGLGGEFWTVIVAYNILQILDGNVLVPIIFSEAVNLHPVAIIFAILFFGGIWGLAGVFFAIPLATLIQAIINAWPSRVQSKSITG
ncbi:MAG: AI-2E family transporter [Pseudohongiellaceae bacterium]|nr:AI-2E family transporter [Gammaproteobacteria bacterium]OUV77690.1 MAG: AI-2E family transporter [Gammaproteobacteria bacterium TMED139]|tara:strand:+ start:1779 stop:2849 length:1071 start_codon:yes stop_codon:yes gene_type:complete